MQIHAIYHSRRVLVFLTSIAVIGFAVPCVCVFTRFLLSESTLTIVTTVEHVRAVD